MRSFLLIPQPALCILPNLIDNKIQDQGSSFRRSLKEMVCTIFGLFVISGSSASGLKLPDD